MHKQNCTSFNSGIVITYPKNNGKPFLGAQRAYAHNCQKAHIACQVGLRMSARIRPLPGQRGATLRLPV
ncbi:hypothetical protein B9D02_08885 [Pantoea vagans]|nr:hypothetical protein B9D02_08885 [Pantoea vagans]